MSHRFGVVAPGTEPADSSLFARMTRTCYFLRQEVRQGSESRGEIGDVAGPVTFFRGLDSLPSGELVEGINDRGHTYLSKRCDDSDPRIPSAGFAASTTGAERRDAKRLHMR